MSQLVAEEQVVNLIRTHRAMFGPHCWAQQSDTLVLGLSPTPPRLGIHGRCCAVAQAHT